MELRLEPKHFDKGCGCPKQCFNPAHDACPNNGFRLVLSGETIGNKLEILYYNNDDVYVFIYNNNSKILAPQPIPTLKLKTVSFLNLVH